MKKKKLTFGKPSLAKPIFFNGSPIILLKLSSKYLFVEMMLYLVILAKVDGEVKMLKYCINFFVKYFL